MTEVDYRVISALMQQLPKNGKWTGSQRERWIAALVANLDLQIDIENQSQEQPTSTDPYEV